MTYGLEWIIPAVAAAAGAGAKFAGNRGQAKAMMPEEYEAMLRNLKAREQVGQLGLTDTDRARLEADAAAQRGGAVADARAQQRQTTQAMAGSGAIGGREMFLNELAIQEATGQMMEDAAQRIEDENLEREKQNQQLMMELAQRRESAKAAKKAATWTALGDVFKIGGQIGGAVFGAKAQQDAQDNLLAAQAGGNPEEIRTAERKVANANMAMAMVGGYGVPVQAPPTYTQPTQGAQQGEMPVPGSTDTGAQSRPPVYTQAQAQQPVSGYLGGDPLTLQAPSGTGVTDQAMQQFLAEYLLQDGQP